MRIEIGKFKLIYGEKPMTEDKPKPSYKLTLKDLDECYRGAVERTRSTEGPHPATPAQNQAAGSAAQSIAGIGSEPLYDAGEYNLLRLFLTNDAELSKIEEFLRREYPNRPLAWGKVVEWANGKLNPPDKVEVEPKKPEDFLKRWECGCYSNHSMGEAALMAQGIAMGSIVCSGYDPKKKRWGGCGKRFTWSSTENKFVEDERPHRVTASPRSIFSDLGQHAR